MRNYTKVTKEKNVIGFAAMFNRERDKQKEDVSFGEAHPLWRKINIVLRM